ncbi:MAG TPA: DUF1284 domain-containing protein [Rhodospirillaceae bacterium]|nr:DUF1284 domain-containing protein [Rhodospirillaceae bacterium]
MKTPIDLRGHHVLCLLTYIGRGYSTSFTENLNTIVSAFHRGHAAKIVSGYDALCHCESTPFHCPHKGSTACRTASVETKDKRTLSALRVFAPHAGHWQIGQAFHFTQPLVAELRQAFKAGSIRPACSSCEWQGLCDEIAASDFRRTLFFSSLPQGPSNTPK